MYSFFKKRLFFIFFILFALMFCVTYTSLRKHFYDNGYKMLEARTERAMHNYIDLRYHINYSATIFLSEMRKQGVLFIETLTHNQKTHLNELSTKYLTTDIAPFEIDDVVFVDKKGNVKNSIHPKAIGQKFTQYQRDHTFIETPFKFNDFLLGCS